MQSRKTESVVTFRHLFSIGASVSDQPAGSYQVTKEEELIEGLSFAAYHVASLVIEVPAIEARSVNKQRLSITVDDLAAALERDAAFGEEDRLVARSAAEAGKTKHPNRADD
ncbi:hypothetical protein [Rhizobium sp. FKL33]|uniref:hypothetical protein n=1 Tax=Rhizobium sp. FKL33 TaxID=2562307 RepID=UPI0010C02CAE|nr:hypothetical protein [Rhizobium sp. FKL33]